MFAKAILKTDELPPDPKDERVYDLNPLLQKSFAFVFEVGTGIQNVVVRKLRLSSKFNHGDRITLEADTSRDALAVYTLLERLELPLQLYNVTQVELGVSVVTDISKPAKSLTFRVTYPNSCTLKYDELDLRLRDMLHASGIEPKDSVEAPAELPALPTPATADA